MYKISYLFLLLLPGINAVIFYSTDIFRAAGLKDLWPVYGTIILGGVQIVMTAVCMFIIDKAGRKILLLSGMIGMSLFSFLLAVCRIFGVIKFIKNSFNHFIIL